MWPLGGVRCGKKRGELGASPPFGLQRLAAGDASWGEGGVRLCRSASRRGLPAPPSSWPELPSSASGQRPAGREAGRAEGARSPLPPSPGAAQEELRAEAQPPGPAAGPGRGTGRGRPAGGGAGGIQAGGAGADWSGAAT